MRFCRKNRIPLWSELASGGRVSHDDKPSGDDRKIKSMRELEQWVGEVTTCVRQKLEVTICNLENKG